MAGPDLLIVEIEFVSGTWTDVSAYVSLRDGMSHGFGRTNAYEVCSTGSLSLVLDNPDGRFTPGAPLIKDPTTSATSPHPYYPNVLENKRIRVRLQHGNLFGPDSSFEVDTSPWFNTTFGWDTTTLTSDPTYAQAGTRSAKCVFPASVNGTAGMAYVRDDLLVGQTYTFSIYGRANTSEPDWRVAVYGGATGSLVTTKNAMTRGTVTFTASATQHTLIAYSQSYSAGKIVYFDAAQLDVGSTARAYRGTGGIYELWTGYIDSLTMTFDGGQANWNRVQVNASDRFKVLARRQLQGVYEEVARFAGASAFYPLTVDDTVSGVDVADTIRQAGVGSIVAPAFNPAATYEWSSEGPAQLNGALAFAAGGAANDGAGYGSGVAVVPPLLLGSTAFTLTTCVWFNTTASIPASGVWLFSAAEGVLKLNSSDQLFGGVGNAFVNSAASVNDGQWHCGLVVTSLAAGIHSAALYLDGVLIGSSTTAAVAESPRPWALNGIIDPGFAMSKARGSYPIAYSGLMLAATDLSAHAADLYAAGANGIFGETVAARATRIFGWCGMGASEYRVASDTSAVIGTQDVAGKSALAALQELGVAEYAPVFVAGDGVVEVQSRAARATVTPAQTFDAVQDLDGSALSLALADEGVVNQVVGQVTGGASVTVYVSSVMSDSMTDALSSSPLSPISDTVGAPWSTLDQAEDAANRRLVEGFQARLRLDQLTIDPYSASSDIWVACAELAISDMTRLTSLPPTMAGGSTQRDLWAESAHWDWSMSGALLTVDTTAVDDGFGQAIFDDLVTGRFTHDGGVMTVGTVGCLSGTGTGTFGMVTASGPLWSVAGGDYPLTVKIGEEEITLSAMSGGASPQTATVSARGVNGTTAYAHATGSAVELWPVPCFAH